MALAILSKNGRFYPSLTYDGCAEVIDSSKPSLIAFATPSDGETVPVQVFHKGQCDTGRAGSRSPDARFWLDLQRYIPWLLWNGNWGGKFEESPQGAKLILDAPDPIEFE